jgi:hypothetical protein
MLIIFTYKVRCILLQIYKFICKSIDDNFLNEYFKRRRWRKECEEQIYELQSTLRRKYE